MGSQDNGINKKRIFMVDDSEIVLATLEEALVKEGYDTKAVLFPCPPNYGPLAGQVALFHPQLVLADVDMPQIRGDEFVEVLRSDPSFDHIKVYFYSSEPEEKLQALVEVTGADGYIRKSSKMPEVLGVVERILTRNTAVY